MGELGLEMSPECRSYLESLTLPSVTVSSILHRRLTVTAQVEKNWIFVKKDLHSFGKCDKIPLALGI